MKYVEAQFLVFQMNAMRAHAEIVSGAYKLAKTQRGVVGGGWRDLTDEEKLEDKVDEMKRHCHHMWASLEYMGDEVK